MGTVQQIAVAIAVFLAFAIGLNLGLHGVIYFHESSPLGSSHHEDIVSSFSNENDLKPTSPIAKIDVNQQSIPEREPTLPVRKELDHTVSGKGSTDKQLSVEDRILSVEAKLLSEMDKSKFSNAQLDSYKNTPVLLLTCNRAALLRETIASLLTVRGVKKDQILIIQDGNLADVAAVVKENEIALVQNLSGLRLRGGAGSDGASRIAEHYKFALTTGFERFPSANAVIIVEDDLLFSPDFYEYLTSTAPILDVDNSAFVVSAWNDNGFHSKVREPYAIRRTEFFPGLGWILPRKLYKEELEPKWPHEHWDHWLRSPETHRNRESIYPQMPRTYHNGVKGTFMDENTHNRYFRDIHNNRDESISWTNHEQTVSHIALVTQANYEQRIEELVKNQCVHVESLADLFSEEKNRILCLWINVAISADYTPPFETVGRFFGIWHEHHRGNHKGLHEFYYEGNYVLLLNTHSSVINSHYRDWKPAPVHAFTRDYFANKQALMSLQTSKVTKKVYRAQRAGISCHQVCQENINKVCKEDLLPYVNNCDMLKQHFPCTECSGSLGAEQPAYVREDAPSQSLPRHCLFNQDTSMLPITCGAAHPDTLRLCVCE